jgi:threonine dehydrogenase-like Zn-dependent dehydrogenase
MSDEAETARALWVTGPGSAEIRAETLGLAPSGGVTVDALYSGVSRGTESLVFTGRVPVTEYTRMRCPFQAGDFPAPVKYGYANVGLARDGSHAGRFVFCLYPHQTKYRVPESALVPLPAGVPPERAVLAANLETAVNAVWDARPLVGDRVTVVGAGVLGCLVAYLVARIPGTEVELVDVEPSRRAVAAALGVSFSEPRGASRERDLVFHATGRAGGCVTALELAATDATVVELSWFGDGDVALPLGRDFHVRRLTLRSSQVGTVSPTARRRFTHRTRLELALSLLTDARLDALIDAEVPFAALPAALERLATTGGLCTRVKY